MAANKTANSNADVNVDVDVDVNNNITSTSTYHAMNDIDGNTDDDNDNNVNDNGNGNGNGNDDNNNTNDNGTSNNNDINSALVEISQDMKEKEITISTLEGRIAQLENEVVKKSNSDDIDNHDNSNDSILGEQQKQQQQQQQEQIYLQAPLPLLHKQLHSKSLQEDIEERDSIIEEMRDEIQRLTDRKKMQPSHEADRVRLRYLEGIVRDLEKKLANAKGTHRNGARYGSLGLYDVDHMNANQSCSSNFSEDVSQGFFTATLDSSLPSLSSPSEHLEKQVK